MKQIIKNISLGGFVLMTSIVLQAQEVSFETKTSLSGNNTFKASKEGILAFADFDSDGDQDIIASEYNGATSAIHQYKNDGKGNFIPIGNVPFAGISRGAIAIADVDQDQDQDILITGLSNHKQIAQLYINQGNGTFDPATNNPFTGVDYSTVTFADIDNDQDQDVLITGLNEDFKSISEIYKNDGIGNYTKVSHSLTGVSMGAVEFADVDNDQDLDLLITGLTTGFSNIASLYKNDGSGNFEITKSSFVGVHSSSLEFADVDNDKDLDVLIAGLNSEKNNKTILYLNDGRGTFKKIKKLELLGIRNGDVAFADIDNDNDLDIYLSGLSNSQKQASALYINQGFCNFEAVPDIPFTPVSGGNIAFADVDNDQDLDIMINGKNDTSTGVTQLYKNQTLSSNKETINNSNGLLIFYQITPKSIVLASQTTITGAYTIFDITGKKLTTGTMSDQKHVEINFDAPKGIYILEVTDSNQQNSSFKFLKH